MPHKTPHILVTDDERSIRSTLKEILEFEDYIVSTVESGQQALDFLEDNYLLIFLGRFL